MFFRLRNKRGKVPEIIERAQETLIAQSESDLELTAFVGKILTVDGKNSIIVTIIGDEIMVHC